MIVTRRTPASRLLHALRWLAFILIAFILNLPILATIITSFKTAGDINTSPPVWLFTPTLGNYEEVLFTGNTDLVSYIINSILIAAGGTLLAIVTEEVVPQAHAAPDSRVAAGAVVGGFALFALISVLLGG